MHSEASKLVSSNDDTLIALNLTSGANTHEGANASFQLTCFLAAFVQREP